MSETSAASATNAEDSFVAVGSVDDLADNTAKRLEIDGKAICLARSNGEVRAIGDVCSHADVSLSEGEVSDGSVECWLHGSTFDLTTGKPSGLPAFRPVPVYPVKVEDGTIFVSSAAIDQE